MNYQPLDNYLNNFALSVSTDTGGVVWKNDDGLHIGIIVGKDSNGERYVVSNQPNQKIFELQKLKTFESDKYCYFDFNDKFIIRQKTAKLAFDLLHRYNQYNKQSYADDFKIELPQINDFEAPKEAQAFSRGLSSVVYRATLLHVLENNFKSGIKNTRKTVVQNIQSFNQQFKEAVWASFPSLKKKSSV